MTEFKLRKEGYYDKLADELQYARDIDDAIKIFKKNKKIKLTGDLK